jgi:hypothetical protein
MAALGHPIALVVPPGGAPAVATAPHLPFGADRGTITGWLLDATATETSSEFLEDWREVLIGLSKIFRLLGTHGTMHVSSTGGGPSH